MSTAGRSRTVKRTVFLGSDNVKNRRILSYQDKAPAPAGDTASNLNILYSASAVAAGGQKNTNAKLVLCHIPSVPSRILDAPDLMDDYYLNLVDWSDANWLALALAQTVFLWNEGTGDKSCAPVTMLRMLTFPLSRGSKKVERIWLSVLRMASRNLGCHRMQTSAFHGWTHTEKESHDKYRYDMSCTLQRL